jgi:hypothetical protein
VKRKKGNNDEEEEKKKKKRREVTLVSCTRLKKKQEVNWLSRHFLTHFIKY